MIHPVPRQGRAPLLGALAVLLACAAAMASAQPTASGWQAGAVLDLSATAGTLALGDRERGLGLGHSDLHFAGPLGRHFEAQAGAAAHHHDDKLELELEEAWLQTRSLPAGLQLRAGRFASQIGYLNEQHPHADDFVQRPLLHRAFFGGHWNDDGLRLNWIAPTDTYLRLGVEVFRGKRLAPEGRARTPGAFTVSLRTGGDIGRSQGWQAGLSLLHNRRQAAEDGHGHEDHDADHHEDGDGAHGAAAHGHAHGAAWGGRRLWLADLAWKWAPGGNNRQQQLRVSWEHALVEGIAPHASRGDRHHASWLAAVWRFAPSWETGVRLDLLRVREAHGDHFHRNGLREVAAMLAWKPTHAQVLRLQLTRQRDRGGFDAADHAVQLQYILQFGSHAAHAF